jgi:hypothetical protein
MSPRTSLLIEMTSRQCSAYQVQGGDIMLVPVGSVEVLGPHLPIGGRGFAAEAFCRLLAEQVDGLRLPLTPYAPVQSTFGRPGSVDVPALALHTYVRAVLDDLLATGFHRILLVAWDEYLRYYLPQEFYEDHHVAAAGISLGETLHHYGRDEGVGEDSFILGALRLLGKSELARKVESENQRLLAAGFAQPPLAASYQSVRRAGIVGFTYPEGAYPLPPNPALSGEKGERVLRRAAADLAPHLAGLRDYNEHLARRRSARGMTWRGWRGLEGDER